MKRAVLLPGMDGTGELLTEFAAALAPEFNATVVSYPRDIVLGYESLVAFVSELLPRNEAFILIAESFSGPIAIALAAQKPEGLEGVVLCASFAKAPRPMLRPFIGMLQALPLQRLSTRFAMPILMGSWRSRDWGRRVQETVRAVDPAVMRSRLRQVGTVDLAARVAEIDCPLLYLKASHDRLVLAHSWDAIKRANPNSACVDIEGPHFLLQAKSDECADQIKKHFAS